MSTIIANRSSRQYHRFVIRDDDDGTIFGVTKYLIPVPTTTLRTLAQPRYEPFDPNKEYPSDTQVASEADDSFKIAIIKSEEVQIRKDQSQELKAKIDFTDEEDLRGKIYRFLRTGSPNGGNRKLVTGSTAPRSIQVTPLPGEAND